MTHRWTLERRNVRRGVAFLAIDSESGRRFAIPDPATGRMVHDPSTAEALAMMAGFSRNEVEATR